MFPAPLSVLCRAISQLFSNHLGKIPPDGLSRGNGVPLQSHLGSFFQGWVHLPGPRPNCRGCPRMWGNKKRHSPHDNEHGCGSDLPQKGMDPHSSCGRIFSHNGFQKWPSHSGSDLGSPLYRPQSSSERASQKWWNPFFLPCTCHDGACGLGPLQIGEARKKRLGMFPSVSAPWRFPKAPRVICLTFNPPEFSCLGSWIVVYGSWDGN